jgi:uncharacterized protein (DUF697 family)
MTTGRSQRETEAMHIVYRYAAMSAGAALIPTPGADTVVLAGLHAALIKQLCDHYGVSFTDHVARNIMMAVLASVIPGSFGSLASRKAIQVLSSATRVFGWAILSASSAAFTYGLGRLFVTHFESGGTLLSLDTRRLNPLFGRPPIAAPDPDPAASR